MTEVAARNGRRRSRLRRISGHPLFHLVVAILVIAVVQAFFVKVFTVPSPSMENTLHEGDRILVNRLAYSASHEAADGDVVVFRADESWGHVPEQAVTLRTVVKTLAGALGYGSGTEHYLVKRVIGTPGQTVSCCTAMGQLERDGAAVQEDYIYRDFPFVPGTLDCSTQPRSARCFGPVTVPQGRILVMGDHRSDSSDSVLGCRMPGATSECVRWVREDEVVGKAFAIFWPLGRIGGIDGP
ncbi:signal peptidase I [Propionibacterium cyclohexanicum]|uniref:Signal peptidase I n=2 Tax=Propionibacterium cyclohexanicum TaxID=64702 RepID=A0A1H9TXE4_9ACTN|nr:signal peptidase I [Propionibacterium cyclohexanicum]